MARGYYRHIYDDSRPSSSCSHLQGRREYLHLRNKALFATHIYFFSHTHTLCLLTPFPSQAKSPLSLGRVVRMVSALLLPGPWPATVPASPSTTYPTLFHHGPLLWLKRLKNLEAR